MSSFCRKGKRARGRKWGLSISVFLLLPSSVSAGPYADLDARLRGRPEADAVRALAKAAQNDGDAQAALDEGPRAARAYIALRASLEGAEPSKLPPIGPGPGEDRIASSWLGRALERLHRPRFDRPEFQGASSGGVGPWATYVMWGLLAALGLLAACLLVRYARVPRLKRRARAIVDEDEPVRSADAWLEEANALIAQGRYREAVRGLYVAGLLRFDEAGVARFDRHQTNWEHLRRIEASPKRPEGTEIRDATGRFDRVWYGHLAATLDEAVAMRTWYDTLVGRLAEAKAP